MISHEANSTPKLTLWTCILQISKLKPCLPSSQTLLNPLNEISDKRNSIPPPPHRVLKDSACGPETAWQNIMARYILRLIVSVCLSEGHRTSCISVSSGCWLKAPDRYALTNTYTHTHIRIYVRICIYIYVKGSWVTTQSVTFPQQAAEKEEVPSPHPETERVRERLPDYFSQMRNSKICK